METTEISELNAKLDSIRDLALLGAKNVLTIDDAAVMTGLSKGYLYRLTSSQRIPHYKLNGRNLYFKKDEIEAWLLQTRIGTIEEIESMAATHVATNKKTH